MLAKLAATENAAVASWSGAAERDVLAARSGGSDVSATTLATARDAVLADVRAADTGLNRAIEDRSVASVTMPRRVASSGSVVWRSCSDS